MFAMPLNQRCFSCSSLTLLFTCFNCPVMVCLYIDILVSIFQVCVYVYIKIFRGIENTGLVLDLFVLGLASGMNS